MGKKTPTETLVAALQAYVAEGGELTFEENPPRGVYPVGEVTKGYHRAGGREAV